LTITRQVGAVHLSSHGTQTSLTGIKGATVTITVTGNPLQRKREMLALVRFEVARIFGARIPVVAGHIEETASYDKAAHALALNAKIIDSACIAIITRTIEVGNDTAQLEVADVGRAVVTILTQRICRGVLAT